MGPSYSFYKIIEKEINDRIHAKTNCRLFTLAFGKALEDHLDRISLQRKIMTDWLKDRDLATKEDLAVLAERAIVREERLDFLEDLLYSLNKSCKENHIRLIALNESLLDMRESFHNELKACKIQSLETELADLKKLFQ